MIGFDDPLDMTAKQFLKATGPPPPGSLMPVGEFLEYIASLPSEAEVEWLTDRVFRDYGLAEALEADREVWDRQLRINAGTSANYRKVGMPAKWLRESLDDLWPIGDRNPIPLAGEILSRMADRMCEMAQPNWSPR